MEQSPQPFDNCRQNIEDKLLGLQLSLSNNEEIDYEDLRQMLTQIITPAASELEPDQQNEDLVLDSPFKWKPISEKNSPADRIKDVLEKKKGYMNETDSKWMIIVLNLVLCYEYTIHENDREMASRLLDECDATLVESCRDPNDFVSLIESALRRVVDSSRYLVSVDASERGRALSRLRPHAELSRDEVGAVWGLRGAVHMEYGYTGNRLAEMYLHTAIKFDPNVAQWHFLYGQCLGRHRHIVHFRDLPRDVELIALERAVELSANPYYAVHLAQAYREAASGLGRHPGADADETVRRMNRRAVELYEQALGLCPDCPFINVRCAQGFMRFNSPERDYARAYECCRKAIEACPANTMINHVWGQINERVRNYKVANKHLRIAAYQGAFGACMDLVRLSFRTNRTYDPRPLYQDMLKRFPEEPYQMEVWTQLAMYHYVKLGDLPTAVDYLMKCVHLDPLSDKLKNHRSAFANTNPNTNPNTNVYHVLVEAAEKVSDEDERRVKFGRVISICKANYPELLDAARRKKTESTDCDGVRLEPEKKRDDNNNNNNNQRGNWRNNPRGDGNWRKANKEGGNWREPEGRNNANGGYSRGYCGGGQFDRHRERGGNGGWGGRRYTQSESTRSDYGSDRDAWSDRGSGYASSTGSHSDYGSNGATRGRRRDDIDRLAEDVAKQRLDDGAGDRAYRQGNARAKSVNNGIKD